MKYYLVLVGYQPSRSHDYGNMFTSLEEAEQDAKKHAREGGWWHVLDSQTGDIVRSSQAGSSEGL